MAEKRNNRYKIQLQELELKDGREPEKQIEFEFENHDDIFALIERTKDKKRFTNTGDDVEFMVGLKLFSEVMLRNRENELFKNFAPAFSQFMKELKGK